MMLSHWCSHIYFVKVNFKSLLAVTLYIHGWLKQITFILLSRMPTELYLKFLVIHVLLMHSKLLFGGKNLFMFVGSSIDPCVNHDFIIYGSSIVGKSSPKLQYWFGLKSTYLNSISLAKNSCSLVLHSNSLVICVSFSSSWL